MRLPIGSGPMQPSPKQGTIKNFWWLAHRVVMQKSLLSVHDQNMVRLQKSAMARHIINLSQSFADFVLPPRCLLCRDLVTANSGLCPDCWNKQRFIAPPLCDRCGLPFAFADQLAGDGVQFCAACLAKPPLFSRARAALIYDDASRPLVLNFKHGDQLHMAKALAMWMAQAGAPLLTDCDMILPVPLHPKRLFSRRFNQAAVLAKHIVQIHGTPLNQLILRRIRATPSQGQRRRAERHRNVTGAFRVTAAGRSLIADRRILVVDDVHTTGATLSAVTATLLQAGAAKVDALTLARVP